jgi:hypothetical protein
MKLNEYTMHKKGKQSMNPEEEYEIDILFNCMYLEIKITFHIHEH